MRRMQMYPFLFALSVILNTYFHIDENYSLLSVFIAAFCLILITVILHVLLSKFYDKDRVDIAISVSWIWLFSYSAFRALMDSYNGGWSEKVLIPAWILVFVIACSIILKRKAISNSANRYFTALGILMVVMGVWPSSRDPRSDFKPTEVINQDSSFEQSRQHPDSLPDIYYLLLDAYPAAGALKDVANIDNSEFTNFLKHLGFIVADRSYSNYPFTLLSLCSTLNMQYLPMISRGENSYELNCNSKSLENSIRESLVIKYLRAYGYKFVDLSIWDFGKESDYHFEKSYLVDRLAMELLNKTILSTPIIQNVIVGLEERKMDRLKLAALTKVAQLKGPIFTYVHLYSTHQPYVLDENGNRLPLIKRIFESSSDRSLFHGQMTFVTRQARLAIEDILQYSSRPPIIILQGDHGPPIGVGFPELRIGMLNAFYLPGVTTTSLPGGISPVNNFRIVFNKYFNTNLDLLEGRQHYYPTSTTTFTEVSDSLR